MKSFAFLILIDDEQTRVVRASAAGLQPHEAPSPDQRGDFESGSQDQDSSGGWPGGVRQALDALGYRGEPATLGLPSGWVLAASVSTDGLPRRDRAQALAYRLEEQLPIPAEDYVADFIEHGGRALGVAVVTGRVRSIVAALESAGIPIDTMTPTALLATQAYLAQKPTESPGILELESGCAIDRIELQDGKPVSWRSCRSQSPVLSMIQGLKTLESPATDHRTATFHCRVDDVLCGGSRAGTGRGVNLRTGALAVPDRLRSVRRPLRRALAAACLGLLALTSVLWFQSQRIHAEAGHIARQQRAVFTATLPGRRVPANPRLVLESEARRLSATAGDDAGIPDNGHAVETLYELMRRLPSDLRYRVWEVRIDNQRIQLQGEARSHGDADLIASSLRRQKGFDVQPARTERLRDQGVAFTLTADRRVGPAIARKEGQP